MHSKGLSCVFAAVASAIVLATSFAAAAERDGDDVVLLTNGGRLRGTIIEEDPSNGVRVKLSDGTMRTLKPGEVRELRYHGAPTPSSTPEAAPNPPSAPAETPSASLPPAGPQGGSIHVDSREGGSVAVDGGGVGHTPADIHGLAPGRHRVHIDFDLGSSDEQTVLVQSEGTLRVDFEMSEWRRDFATRWRGSHLGLSVGPSLIDIPLSSGGVYMGVRAAVFDDIGLAPAFTLRLGVSTNAAAGGAGWLVPVAGFADARWHIGPVYTLSLGIQAGAVYATKVNTCVLPGSTSGLCEINDSIGSGAWYGVSLSPVSIRLGPLEFEARSSGSSMPVQEDAQYEGRSRPVVWELSVAATFVFLGKQQ